MIPIPQAWGIRECFLFLTGVADRTPDSGLVALPGEEEYPPIPEIIPTGLPPDLYTEVWLPNISGHVVLETADGGWVEMDPEQPGAFTVLGPEAFTARVQDLMGSSTPPSKQTEGFCLAVDTERPRPPTEIMRQCFRWAGSVHGSFFVADEKEDHARLIRVSSTWLLDAYEHPIVSLVRFPDGSWVLWHHFWRKLFFTDTRTKEAHALLDQIKNKTGGRQDG